MGQTLTNGIFLPNEGERNCYAGLAANWRAINGYIGDYNVHVADAVIHVSQADRDKWDAVDNKADASALTAHTGNTTIHVTAADKEAWNGKADASALTAHTGNTTIHVTAADKESWNGKADASALTAHTGNTTIHVTAEDKNKWDAVTGKADDASVVHKSGAETVEGPKTFSRTPTLYNSDTSGSTANLYLRNQLITKGDTSSSGNQTIRFADVNDKLIGRIQSNKVSNGASSLNLRADTIDTGNNDVTVEVQILAGRDGSKSLSPQVNNSIDLGRTLAKWKNIYINKINDLNPGALFLPQDRSAYVDISAYFTNTASGDNNQMTVPADGWIYLALDNVAIINLACSTSGGSINYADSRSRASDGSLFVTFPVRKNDVFKSTWYTTAAAVTVSNAFFIPCKGNI